MMRPVGYLIFPEGWALPLLLEPSHESIERAREKGVRYHPGSAPPEGLPLKPPKRAKGT